MNTRINNLFLDMYVYVRGLVGMVHGDEKVRRPEQYPSEEEEEGGHGENDHGETCFPKHLAHLGQCIHRSHPAASPLSVGACGVVIQDRRG